MPEFLPNTRISDCWSSVGDVTFYHRDGKCYWRSRSRCRFKGTPEQMKTADVHRKALAAWRELSHFVQLRWNEYAREVPSHKPPFDGRGHITGHNLFVSAYHGFAQMGNEHVPEPVKWRPFPVLDIDSISVVCENDKNILKCASHLNGTLFPEQYRLHLKVQFVSKGECKHPGLMRAFIADDNFKSSDCFVNVKSGNPQMATDDSNGYRIFVRYSLIDTLTGYRNLYCEKTFTVPFGGNKSEPL